MSTSIKFVSPSNREKIIFITHEQGWKNTKLYVAGKLIKTYENPNALKQGVTEKIEDTGTIVFKLHPTTLKPSISVNDEIYVSEKYKHERVKGLNGLIAIFGILALMNLLLFLMMIVQGNESQFRDVSLIQERFTVAGGFFTLLYAATFITLARGIYFLYFISSGFFLMTTIWVGSILFGESNPPTLAIVSLFLPRVIILILLATYFKPILDFMKAPTEETAEELLDDSF